MTLGTAAQPIDYIENGSTLSHPVTFQFQSVSEILCTRIPVGGPESALLTRGVDFNVTGGGGSTGTVTKTSAGTAGTIFRIRRRTSRSQSTDFVAHDSFPAEVAETSLDRLAAVNQEQDSDLAALEIRSLRFPHGQETSDLPANRTDTLLGFSGAGSTQLYTAAMVASLIASAMAPLLATVQKGDPGGNVMAIGPFLAASGLNIPSGTDLVRTSGYALSTPGVGVADYVADAAVDAAYVTAHPRTAFISANGRGFRLSSAQTITIDMFGATPGGTVDCRAAFDAAIARGGDIAVPDGIYRIVTDSSALQANNAVRFYGRRGGVLLIGGAYGNGVEVSQRLTFDGLTLKRADAVQTAILFFMQNGLDGFDCRRCLIDGNMRGQLGGATVPYYVEFSARGLFASSPSNLHWRFCEFTDTGNRCFDMRSVTDSSVTDCDFHDCGIRAPLGGGGYNPGTCVEFTANETGGYVGQSKNITVTDNRFKRWGDGAINSRMVADHTIANNVMEGWGCFGQAAMGIQENGIAVLGGTNVAVTGNTVRLVKSGGILLQTRNDAGVPFDCDNLTVSGNTLIGGPDPFNVGGTATLETSLQIKNQQAANTFNTWAVTGNTLRYSAAGMQAMALTCNATTGLAGGTISGNAFFGPGIADGSKAIVLTSAGIANLLGLNISGNSFHNWQYAVYQPAGILPPDATIAANAYGNCPTRSNIGPPTVVQSTSKSTTVPFDAIAGQIIMNAANLPAGATASFTLTNNKITAGDTVAVSVGSGASPAAYLVQATGASVGSARIELRNYSVNDLAQAVVINFAVLKPTAG
jgi:hypothetical protein